MTVHVLDVVPPEQCPNASACLAAANWHNVGGPEPDCACEARQSIDIAPTVWEGHPLTCETCGWTQNPPDRRRNKVCPDCVAGAPIIDWQLPCEHERCPPPPVHCLHWRTNDKRPVRVSIQAVPIHAVDDDPRPTDRLFAALLSDTTVMLVWPDGEILHRAVPGNAKPGDYLIIGTEVE